MRDEYKPDWFYWVHSGFDQIGFVCFKLYGNALHLHMVVIADEFQSSGNGRNVMSAIHDIARANGRDVTLSSFKCNERAVKLYKSLNYETTKEEEHFLLFRLPHNKNL